MNHTNDRPTDDFTTVEVIEPADVLSVEHFEPLGNASLVEAGSSSPIHRAIELVTNSLTSDHSKRAYTRALQDFLHWITTQKKPFIKATVNEYRQTLTGSPASINLRMSAIRKLASEASDNGLLDSAIANGVKNVKGVTQHGVRTGNWLTKNQAQELLTTPDITTLKGLRDRAIFAVMIGAGLRRSEVVKLETGHIAQLDGRWVILDLSGKGNHIRTVPIGSWVKVAIDEWTDAAGITDGIIFRAINKGDNISRDSMTAQAIRDIVSGYGEQIGVSGLAAHDLRRTFAKLAHKGGSGVDQIQLSLGHQSMKTTERYLGVSQNLTDAPADHLGLALE